MKYTSKQYAKAIWEIWGKKPPAKRTAILNSFIKFLKKRRDFKKIKFIEQELEKIYLAKNNLLKAEVAIPYPLSESSVRKTKQFISSPSNTIAKSVKKHYNQSIILDRKIDKNLIGGFQIKTDDILIDASVKNVLLKLKRMLTAGV